MNGQRIWFLVALSFTIAFFLAQTVHASTDTIGTNGIRSAGLLDANSDELDGDGTDIGQVEPQRPGKPGYDTDAMCCNGTVEPTGVFRRDATAGVNQDFADHALYVAGVMISSATTAPEGHFPPTGVAPEAALYSSAHDALPDDQVSAAVAAQHVATVANVRATNMSFGMLLDDFYSLDGNSHLTLFTDWSASRHDILYVVAGNDGSDFYVPTDNFNGMTVAASTKAGDGVFRQVSLLNDYSPSAEAVGDRTSTDILAPGVQIDLTGPNGTFPEPPDNSGTSFAAPLVTGTVALLQEYGKERIMNAGAPQWTANARRHEVMKTVMMNSADKLEDTGDGNRLGMQRTVVDTDGTSTWLDSDAFTDPEIPLDLHMGTGHLNASRALAQFSPGEYEADAADIPLIGWDYGHLDDVEDINKYVFDSELRGSSFISLTLAWDRIVNLEDLDSDNEYDSGEVFSEDLDFFNILRLYVLPKDSDDFDDAIAMSTSSSGTVQHIFAEIPTTGEYEIWVEDAFNVVGGGQDYALAWWAAGVPAVGLNGDFNGNNEIDAADYTVWRDALTAGATTLLNDPTPGTVDESDFLYWRDHFGETMGSGAGSAFLVPEPTSLGLLFVGCLFTLVGQRRSALSWFVSS